MNELRGLDAWIDKCDNCGSSVCYGACRFENIERMIGDSERDASDLAAPLSVDEIKPRDGDSFDDAAAANEEEDDV